MKQAVIDQLAAMAGSDDGNEVLVTLDRAGTPWDQLTDTARERLIRTLVGQVRYDGRTGQVTIQFDMVPLDESTPEEVARIEGEANESDSD